MEYHKQGSLGGSVGAVIGLIVGMGVATLILIFVGVLGGKTYNIVEDDLNAIQGVTAITGDAFTASNSTAVSLSHKDLISGTLKVYNATTPYTQVGNTNFTINYADGGLILKPQIDAAGYHNAGLAANYSYGSNAIRSSVKNGIVSGFEANEQTGELLPVIVLAFVITIVLSLVLSFTMVGRGGSDNSAL